MPEIIVDSHYIALKLIRFLYEKGQINRETYECVVQTYGSLDEKSASGIVRSQNGN